MMNFYESKTYLQDLKTAITSTVGLEDLKNKRILVTGATGTIGSFLVDMLLEYSREGAETAVFAAGRSVERLEQRFGPANSQWLTCVPYDMMEPISWEFPVDYIIHGAGNAHPAAFNGDPVGTIVENVGGTYGLLCYARDHGVRRVCYLSSGEVYGQGDLSLAAFREDYSGYLDPLSPRSCYPTSKRAAETLCASFTKQYGLETVIVRPCHTYGPGITASDNRANVQFLRNALKGEEIVLKSAGTQMRSYSYVADCASAILTCLLKGEPGQAYNSANPEARVTIAGLAEIIAGSVGRRVVYADPDGVDLANRTPIARQVLDTAKLEALGWKGAFSVETGIWHTIAILEGK